MPFISGEMVEWLLGHDDSAADAVIPHHAGGIEPFFAIYHAGFLGQLEDALGLPGDAVDAALRKSSVRYVEAPARFESSEGFAHVYTAEAYARALQIIRANYAARSD